MALKGNLRDFSVQQLLNLIHLAHKTGTLAVQSANGSRASASFYFREGRLIHAAFDAPSICLTDLLVRSGKLTPEQAQEVQKRSRVGTDKELGLLLINGGILSRGDIIEGVRGHLLDSVYHLFTWQEGEFRFEQNALPPDDRLAMPVNLQNVILEGSRRQQEGERLRADLPDLDVGIRFGRRPHASLRNISLTPEQWKVISLINSGSTVREIGRSLSLDDFQLRRVILGLCRSGLVEVASPNGRRPAAGPAPGARVTKGLIMRIIDGIRRR